MNQTHHKQKYLEILQTCKQIPKDDRLILRKQIIDNNLNVRQLFNLKEPKKMQIKLRKIVQFIKANRKNQQIYNNIQHQAKYKNNQKSLNRISHNQLQGIYRLSADCCRKSNLREKEHANSRVSQNTKNIQIVFQQQSFKKVQNCQKLLQSLYCQSKCKQNLNQPPKIRRNNQEDKSLKQFILKQKNIHQNNIDSKWNIYNFFESRTTPNSQFFRDNNQNLYTDPKIIEDCKQFLSRIGTENLTKFTHKSTQSQLSQAKVLQIMQTFHKPIINESQQSKIRSLLLGSDSQSVFDTIIERESCQGYLTPSSFYISYQQFLKRLNKFTQKYKSHSINIVDSQSNTTIKQLPLFPPFFNQFQYVDLNKIVQFLQFYTITKPNKIRTLFLQINPHFKEVVTIQQFKEVNQWRGSDVIESFKRLVNCWGKWGQHIGYWQIYWAKQSKQLKDFTEIYEKSFY